MADGSAELRWFKRTDGQRIVLRLTSRQRLDAAEILLQGTRARPSVLRLLVRLACIGVRRVYYRVRLNFY